MFQRFQANEINFLFSRVIEEVETEETDGIERRLQDSDKILSELIQLGTELVTNVKVANEKREVARRNNEASKREGKKLTNFK